MVTGGGRGIGRAIALALAEQGANVVVCDLGCASDGSGHDDAPADTVAQECRAHGVGAVSCHGDVADFQAADDMVNACVAQFGTIDILCNIAGNFILNWVYDMSERQWDAVIDVHLKGSFNLIRHAAPHMKRQHHGRIINCASPAFVVPTPVFGHASYVAAKGGIVSLTYSVAQEMAQHGVTCNAIAPEAKTRMFDEWARQARERGLVSMTLHDAEQVHKEGSDPSYIAPLAAYLASDSARGINGKVFFAEADRIGIYSRPQIVADIRRDWRNQGRWTFEELETAIPSQLLDGTTSD